MLVGNRLGDFLLVLIELFSLGRTAEALRAIIDSKSAISLQRGPVDPKFQVEGVAPPTILWEHIKSVIYLLTYLLAYILLRKLG